MNSDAANLQPRHAGELPQHFEGPGCHKGGNLFLSSGVPTSHYLPVRPALFARSPVNIFSAQCVGELSVGLGSQTL